MSKDNKKPTDTGPGNDAKTPADDAAVVEATKPDTGKEEAASPKEIGGRDGPDPTRYGDWEKGGRCIDF